MKKSIIIIMGMVLAGMLCASVSMAWQQAHMGHMNNPNMQQRSGNYQQFMQDSANVRQQIANDRAKLQTLRAKENPDRNKIEQLQNRIQENISKLQEMANSNNVPTQNRNNQMYRGYHGNSNYHMMGNCWGHNRGRYGNGGCCW